MHPHPLQAAYDSLLVDLDGVVYVGPEAVVDAVRSIESAQAGGLAVAYLTNNASRPARDVARHLRELGLTLDDAQVVTSAEVAARIVRHELGDGARVLAVGGPGVAESLRAEGLVAVRTADDEPQAVVQGYGPCVGWTELAEATFAVRAGALWVATNTDLTIPTPRGIAPGNGTLVAAVRTAVGHDPLVAGKPRAAALHHAAERLGARRPLVLGDRLDTDVQGGRAAGMDTALVLTGVHGLRDAAQAPPEMRPTFVIRTLRALGSPTPSTCVEGKEARCGSAVVRAEGTRLRLHTASADPLEAARAALALVWSERDAGCELRTPDELFEAVHLG